MTDYKPHVTPDPILPPSLTHRDIMHLAPRLIASWRCVKRGGYPPTSVLWRVRSWALRPRLSPSVSVFYFRTGANAGSSYRANDFLPSHASPEKTEQWKLGGQWVQSARQTTQFTCFRLPHTHTHTHTHTHSHADKLHGWVTRERRVPLTCTYLITRVYWKEYFTSTRLCLITSYLLVQTRRRGFNDFFFGSFFN